jgi:methenyltetrahydrofolate cyclohydrolase
MTARRLPRGDERERQARDVQVTTAIREATRVPTVVAQRAAAVLALAERLAPIGNRHAISDVGVAGALAAAGMRGALANVEINLRSLADDDRLAVDAATTRDKLTAGLDEREAALRRAVSAGMA